MKELLITPLSTPFCKANTVLSQASKVPLNFHSNIVASVPPTPLPLVFEEDNEHKV